MKLLFGQNLSPRLVERLADCYPGSCHVQSVGLDCAMDREVWEYAGASGFAVVTKDEDYNALSVLKGCPPKVIWLVLGNCTTAQVEAAFRRRHAELQAFDEDESAGTFVLRGTWLGRNRGWHGSVARRCAPRPRPHT